MPLTHSNNERGGINQLSQNAMINRVRYWVPRDAIPPIPPGPEGSNGNGLVRVQWATRYLTFVLWVSYPDNYNIHHF
jgi:hypothetical protein